MGTSKRFGIVLRFYGTHSLRVIIFDSELGRIETSWIKRSKTSLVQSALINYTLVEWRGRLQLDNVELLDLPQYWVRDDLLFLHHLLEVALFFLPEQGMAEDVFFLFIRLYEPSSVTHADWSLIKKLFLCRVFASLGIYPEQQCDQADIVQSLISLPHDSMLNTISEAVSHNILNAWLLACIHTHPRGDQLNTLSFYQ